MAQLVGMAGPVRGLVASAMGVPEAQTDIKKLDGYGLGARVNGTVSLQDSSGLLPVASPVAGRGTARSAVGIKPPMQAQPASSPVMVEAQNAAKIAEAQAAPKLAVAQSGLGGFTLGEKVTNVQLEGSVPPVIKAEPTPAPVPAPTQPSPIPTPAPAAAPVGTSAPVELVGRSYAGFGDLDNGAKNPGGYSFLPDNIKQQIKTENKYALLADPDQITTLGEYLDSQKRKDGTYPIGEKQQWDNEGGFNWVPDYGTREQFMDYLGFKGAAESTKVSTSNTWAGGGDVTGDGKASKTGGTPYQAISDPSLKGFVQLGNIGPLNDDIQKMLGTVYEKVGATTPEQQDKVKNALFKFDPRFGVLGNESFVEAAGKQNNARQNGWFQKNGAVVAALVSLVNPVAGALLSAATTVANGGSFGDIAKGLVASYAGSLTGGAASGLFNGAGTALQAGVGAATNNLTQQLIRNGGVDVKQLLASGLTAGIGQGVINSTTGLDFNSATTGKDLSLLQRQGSVTVPTGFDKALANGLGGVAGNLVTGKPIDVGTLGSNLLAGYVGDKTNSPLLSNLTANALPALLSGGKTNPRAIGSQLVMNAGKGLIGSYLGNR